MSCGLDAPSGRSSAAGDGDGRVGASAGAGGGQEVGGEGVVELACDVALEAADDLGLGLALGGAALGVGAGAFAVARTRPTWSPSTTSPTPQPSGDTLVDRLLGAGYMRRDANWTVGENLAWGTGSLATPAAIMRAWMASPGHRDILLRRSYREIGIGIASACQRIR